MASQRCRQLLAVHIRTALRQTVQGTVKVRVDSAEWKRKSQSEVQLLVCSQRLHHGMLKCEGQHTIGQAQHPDFSSDQLPPRQNGPKHWLEAIREKLPGHQARGLQALEAAQAQNVEAEFRFPRKRSAAQAKMEPLAFLAGELCAFTICASHHFETHVRLQLHGLDGIALAFARAGFNRCRHLLIRRSVRCRRARIRAAHVLFLSHVGIRQIRRRKAQELDFSTLRLCRGAQLHPALLICKFLPATSRDPTTGVQSSACRLFL
mmetsp:Transcript_16173/g.36749  ORF Transcript_16173/g.36749 Transcript_16173/m.36749 type:complete len:263 (-) Transcript_16173:70-858(-)